MGRSDHFYLSKGGHMAIEDFEWQGDVELTRPSQARLAAAHEAAHEAAQVAQAAHGAGVFERLRKSVWLEPALRILGVSLLLGVLAGIGVVATTYAKPGMKLPESSRLLTNALGTSWLKPSPAPSAATSVALAPTVAAVSSADPAAPAAAEPAPGSAAPVGITADGKVILNQASADELTKLPGVGPKRAQAIVALRAKLKRFKHPTDLLRVKGIGPRSLQRMLPHLVLDAP
jgi:competence ComEA-like helix-hairpin-helix protein